VFLSAGIIISASLGTLAHMRNHFETMFGHKCIYFTISSQPLYLVHWNDLSEEKRQQIEEKKRAKRE